ncbi:MAG: 5'-deoxynucleotidase [Oscillospiraceae bacterium]|nr:5'-deoxynucleotidase [Oscillospiraceae bacterium]
MYAFGALLMRMNYISRWGLMRNARTETLSEHVLITATIANILGYIARDIFGADVDPERITCRAIYHDAGEILNGDLPTPVKYRNDTIRDAYMKLERESEERILESLPEALKDSMRTAIVGEGLSEREEQIVKAADRFSALIKCIEEEQSGNTEFATAKSSTLKKIKTDMLPETEYFLEHFIPAYTLTLDELLLDKGL